jgi:S-adenosyl-L-methionine hydrolase (adenosine-forming)
MKTVFNRLSNLFVILVLAATFAIAAAGCSNQKINLPVILLTDFGGEDYRVPQLKGIIFNSNPDAKLVDASHDVPSFDIPTGAYILDIAAKEFPGNVIFVAITDPYNQPEIRYIVLTTNRSQVFVAPDNGLITYVAKSQGIKSLCQVTNQQLYDRPLKNLAAERIEGRAAALIATGARPQDFGPALSNPRMLDVQEPQVSGQKLLGTVVYIDHYGNCITNIPGDTAVKFGVNKGDTVQVRTSDKTITAKFGNIYSDVPRGDSIVFVSNNLDVVQLSINLGNFSKTYGINPGTRIEIDK